MFDKLKDLGGLMQQAQAMQQKVQELQAELERLEIVGSSGAGLVKVTVNGKNETRRVEIDASLFKPDDKGVVEDLRKLGLLVGRKTGLVRRKEPVVVAAQGTPA